METIVGRITHDAKINTTKDERQLVSFSIAINNSFKTKKDGESKNVVTYINCAYWLSTTIAKHLTKGSIVEIAGRLYVRAYLSGNEPKASLNCHVNHIKIHHFAKVADNAKTTNHTEEAADDLPF